MNLIAFDPGRTTGVVVAHTTDGVTNSGPKFDIDQSFAFGWDDRFMVVYNLLATLPDAIVVESFYLFKHQSEHQIGSEFPSVRVIGVIEAYAWQLTIFDRIHYQQPSVRKRVAVLPEHQVVEMSPHTGSAYRHLRHYLITAAHGHSL